MAGDGMKELEFRLGGVSEAAPRIEDTVRQVDTRAGVRIDPRTGILHVTTSLDTLEVTAVLSRAGYDVTAMTG